MNVCKKMGAIYAMNFFVCLIYLIRSTYMILGVITLAALIINLFYTKNMENILANRMEFISSFLMGGMIFIVRTSLYVNQHEIMIGVMSIVVGFFLMSFYIVIRMIVFSTIRNII